METLGRRGNNLIFVRIEAPANGRGTVTCFARGPVDHLVGDAHHGIQVRDVGADPAVQQARGQGKAGGIGVDDLPGGALGRDVITPKMHGVFQV